MHTQKHHRALLAVALAAAALVASCGGGGEAAPPRAAISKVYVAGDSLADVGTFGMKFTIQNSADPAGFPVFPEIVAQNFGVTGQCNFYVFTGATFAQNPTAGCTNYAIGGGRIVHPTPGDPRAVPVQLATAAQVRGGTWSATDLVVVDGGGNDAADLVGAYIGAAGGGAGALNYQTFLLGQIDPTTLGTIFAGPNPGETAAAVYMQRTADTYYDAIKASLLDKGATHVAVLNVPDITLTPRFQAVLAGVAAANGGGTAGANAAATLQATIRQWLTAFNTRLSARIAGDTRIALVDFYSDLQDEVANAPSYGLTNATQAACPATGVDGMGLPTYDFPTCTSAALDAAPPAGESAGWWQKWAFSDGFHPTPFAQRLLAASVSRAIARAGWL